MMRVLAIETSCDETAAAIIEGDGTSQPRALSNTIASQIAIHAEYGGVFPDVAAREHTKRILPVLGVALKEAGLIDDPRITGKPLQDALASIDAIAVTNGPGLIGPLLVGTSAAMQLAHLSGKPLIPINHWEGHIYSAFLEGAVRSNDQTSDHTLPAFPLLTLTVSGGHTSLILMRDHLDYEILGSTVDDAAGEAFDKTARLLGLPYPGGPKLSAHAAQGREAGTELDIKLPRPLLSSDHSRADAADYLNFSFSGLKTAVRYAIDRGDIALPDQLDAAARAIEDAIVDVLIAKLGRAIEQTKPASVTIVGGVSANRELRRRLFDDLLTSQHPQLTGLLAEQQFTTDNAAMIGSAAIFRLARGEGILTDPFDLVTSASLRLS